MRSEPGRFDAIAFIVDTIGIMDVRHLLLLLSVLATGCAIHPAQPSATVRRPAAIAWDGRADLTLDQITPAPKIAAPASRPVSRPPVEALALYAEARDATIRGQPVVAIDALQKAIALDPFRFQLRYDLGMAYVNASLADDNAIAAFEKAAQLEPDNIDLQSELGQLYLGKSNDAAAIDHLRLALQTTEYSTDDGRAAVADLLLAQALKEAGYDRAALNRYTILLKRFSHPSLSLQQNAQLAYRLERPEALFAQIGELLEKHGEYAEAIDAFQPAVDREPDNFALQSRYARDLALDGRHDPALEKAADLIVRDRATPQSLLVLHDVCHDLNLPDGEVGTLRKLSEKRPGDQAVLFALVDTLSSRHRSVEARQLLESAWKNSPGDVPLTRRLFAMDKKENDVDSAARLIIHALAANPDGLHNFSTLWAELLRAGQTNRLKLGHLSLLQLSAGDEASKQFWIAMTAAEDSRLAVERSALQSSVLQTPPFAPAFRLLLALDLVRSDWSDAQKSQASDQLAAAAKADGDLPLSLEITGRTMVFAKKPTEAADVFTQAVAAGGRSPDLMLAFADAARGIGRDQVYEQRLWKLISDYPLYEDSYLDLFQYYANPDNGTAEQAMKVLSTWLISDPQSLSARMSQVQVDIQQGQVQNAEQELDRLFKEDPDDPELFRMMQQFYNQTGRTNELIGKLEDQRTNHPRDTDLVGKLVLLYSGQKRGAEAIRLLDATRAVVADDADLLYSLTSWYNELGEKQTAEDILQQVVQLNPNQAGACNDLGFEWADEGKNLPRAEALIRVAVQAEPDNESFLDSLGWVLYKRGKFGEAQKYLQQAIGPSAFPDPVVLDHLGDTLYRQSKTDDALQTWQRSLKGLGDGDDDRADSKQLRLQLLQKIKQADAKKPVDVAGVPSQLSVVSGPLSGPATRN
jgi:tetratricopeptide (TPR) repeat protein